MPERTEYANGTPSWVDLQTSDPGAAKSFYTTLFGWTYNDIPVNEDNTAFYSMAQLKGKAVAAIAPAPDQDPTPPHWNCYVTVSDVDGTAARVADAGGTLMMQPFDVMDAGRMAVVQDPTGAFINLWQAKNSIGAELVNETGAFSWSELITPDLPKSAAFYKKLVGWEAETHGDGPGAYTEWKLNGESIGGAMAPPMPGMPSVWGIYFTVDDTDATVKSAQASGGNVFVEPTDIEPGRFAVIADPQGAVFNVITMRQ
jgi:predicted enzyme related to lactoylglutathione lyase